MEAHATSQGPRTMEAHMKFVLVNGRAPREESFCALCCEPIDESYLRELTTGLFYCSYECHLSHCKLAFSVLKEASMRRPEAHVGAA
jgi:hypothetical protein